MTGPIDGRRSLSVARPGAHSLSDLRRWLRANLPVDTDLALDAELICTELVTNAIEHGHGPLEVRIDVEDDYVRVEVDDHDAHPLPAVGRSVLGRHRGRGLAVVDALATWGTTRTPTGKTVWAVLRPHAPNAHRN